MAIGLVHGEDADEAGIAAGELFCEDNGGTWIEHRLLEPEEPDQ